MKRFLSILGIVVLAAAATAFYRDRHGEKPAAQPTVLYGNIDIRQLQLGFRVGGRLKEALLDEGDPVQPGTLVARLDDVPYRNELHSAEARRDQAAALLERAVNGPLLAEIDQARANAEERRADLQLAETTYERYARLLETNVITRESFDQVETARDAAQNRLKASEDSLSILEEGTRYEDIKANLAAKKITDAAVAIAQTSLSDTMLYAPAKGVVTSRVREPGSIVNAGETVFVISLDAPVWARVYVPEPLLGRVHPGREVEVWNDTAPDKKYKAVIGFVSPVAEFTPKSVETPELRTDLVYRARVIISAPDSGLRQGMPVTVNIPAEPIDKADA